MPMIIPGKYDRILRNCYEFFINTVPYFQGEVRDLSGAVRKKTPDELVSDIDIKIQDDFRRIVKCSFGFRALRYPVISEEDCDAWPPKSENVWVIDPLDGTHPFLMGFPNFGISVFLIERGVVTFTSVFLPAEFLFGRTGIYFAELGGGAWKFSVNRRGVSEQFQLRVSDTMHLKDATLLIDGPTKQRTNSEFVKNLLPVARKNYHCFSGPVWGSTRVASANILPNFADLYLNVKSKPWDILPAALLVEEAGGVAVDLNGERYSITNCETLLYGNAALVYEALKIGKRKREEETDAQKERT